MSRCFPFPPPEYVRNGASGEALIESIKLQKEKEKAQTEKRKERKSEKKEKKVRKSEKKEKKRDKKEKGKEKPSEICGEEKKLNDVKSHKGERSRLDSKGGHLQKKIEDEAEQLEKSGLTEEHEQPICLENLCYSSDSTQNSNKRKRHTLPSNGSRNHGNVIRIRLPLQKRKEPDTSLSKEQLCSTSRRTDSRTQQKHEIAQVPSKEECCSTSTRTNIVPEEITPRPDRKLLCSTSGRSEIFAQDGAGTASGSKLFENKMQKAESLYKALMENWVPPPLQSEQTDYNDQQWLFETKLQDRHVAKRLKASNDMPSYGSSSLCPRAHYLSEADIYALPYTIPF